MGKWYIIHDLKAYLVYRKIKEGGNKDKLCKKLAEDKDFKNYIGLDSIIMKIENNRYIDTGQGLYNYSEQCNAVFDEFTDQSIQEIEAQIKKFEKTNLK